MQRIILATGNTGKVVELQQMLANTNIEIVPQSKFAVPNAEETGLTFVENAIIKARQAAQYTGMPAIADDSGLEVAALQGRPGIYSARYAGPQADFTANIAKVLAELVDIPAEQRQARFISLLVYMRHASDPTPIICQGTWNGSILFNPQGEKGFGYDPIFFVPTHGCSAAELLTEEKNAISHRRLALQKLLCQLSNGQ